MFDFPNSPTTNQRVTGSGGQVYTYDGTKWVATGTLAFPDAPSDGHTYARQNAAWTSLDGTTQMAQDSVGRNRLHNPAFSVNQRSYASGTALAAAAYGHDRWKAGAGGCTYTFTQSQPFTTITITAGSLQQVIEAPSVEGGSYMLSWTGTALGRVNAGTYAASPVAVTGLAANAAITVEFNIGTLGQAQFEPGTIATGFSKRDPQQELALCQRFYQVGNMWTAGAVTGASIGVTALSNLPVTLRSSSPTVTFNVTNATNVTGTTVTSYGAGAVIIEATSSAAGGYIAQASYTASADL